MIIGLWKRFVMRRKPQTLHWSESLEPAAESQSGRWVKDEDMHPATNIFNRVYKDDQGRTWRAIAFPLPVKPVEWFFPDPPK